MKKFEYGDRPAGPPVLGYVIFASFVSGLGLLGSFIYMLVV